MTIQSDREVIAIARDLAIDFVKEDSESDRDRRHADGAELPKSRPPLGHDPVRLKYFHVRSFALNDVYPPNHAWS